MHGTTGAAALVANKPRQSLVVRVVVAFSQTLLCLLEHVGPVLAHVSFNCTCAVGCWLAQCQHNSMAKLRLCRHKVRVQSRRMHAT
jgi:hypothetical protein